MTVSQTVSNLTDNFTPWAIKTAQSVKALYYKYTAISLMAKILILTTLFAVAPIGLKPLEIPKYNTNIAFSKNQPVILLQSQQPIQVVLGESEYAKSEREKTEAAQAQAQVVQIHISSNISHSDPSDFDQIYKQAGMQFGIPWQLIKAVHYVETGCSGSTAKRSYAGAQGPMQFMPGTWRAYGVDGNGDGVKDINNVVDAIYGAANLLARGGAAGGNIDGALFNYNHSNSYVNKVKEVAYSIGM
jgi:membrane-bound lytic murein transglycosylase B